MIVSVTQNPPPIDFEAWKKGDKFYLGRGRIPLFLRNADINFWRLESLVTRLVKDERFHRHPINFLGEPPRRHKKIARKKDVEEQYAYTLLAKALVMVFPAYVLYAENLHLFCSNIRIRKPDKISFHRLVRSRSSTPIERKYERQQLLVWRTPSVSFAILRPCRQRWQISEPFADEAWPSLMAILSSRGLLNDSGIVLWQSYSSEKEWWVKLPWEKSAIPQYVRLTTTLALAFVGFAASENALSRKVSSHWINRKVKVPDDISDSRLEEIYQKMILLAEDLNKSLKRS